MDRRDFLKTVAITGAALSIQHSEAMEILTQTINNTNGGNPDLVAVMGGEPEAMFRRAISELALLIGFFRKLNTDKFTFATVLCIQLLHVFVAVE